MWNFEISNSNVNSFYCFQSHKSHLERLMQAKSKIDDKGKGIPFFLSHNISKKKLRKDILEKINNENCIIFNKMLNISEKKSPYSLDEKFPKYCAAFDKKKFSFNKIERNREINKMNNFFYKRFLSIKPTYSTKNFLKQYKKNFENRIKKINFNPNLSFVSFDKFRQNVFNELIKLKISKSNSASNLNEKIKNNSQLIFKKINIRGKLNLNNNYTNFNNPTYLNHNNIYSLSDRAKSASFDLKKRFL